MHLTGSKNKEVAAGMDIDAPTSSGWQTGVSAMTEAGEPSNLPAAGRLPAVVICLFRSAKPKWLKPCKVAELHLPALPPLWSAIEQAFACQQRSRLPLLSPPEHAHSMSLSLPPWAETAAGLTTLLYADMEIGDTVPTNEQEETKKSLKMKGGNVRYTVVA